MSEPEIDNLTWAAACRLVLTGHFRACRLPLVLYYLAGWGWERLQIRWCARRAGLTRAELAEMEGSYNRARAIWR